MSKAIKILQMRRAVARVRSLACTYVITMLIGSVGLVPSAQAQQAQQAQHAPQAPSTLGDAAQDSSFALPLPRALTEAPPIAAIGYLDRGTDTAILVSLTPKTVLGDLEYYRNTLTSQHPLTAPTDPSELLHVANRTRAAAWLARLGAGTVPDPDGTQALALAEIAIRAENDSAARRILGTLLATARDRITQSRVLAVGVDLFTDLTTDRARDTARLSTAVGYASALLQLNAMGMTTQRDSVNVLYHQVSAMLDLVAASCALGRVADVRQYTNQLHTIVTRLGARERTAQLQWYYPLDDIAALFLDQPNGRQLLDTASEIRRIVALAPGLNAALRRAALIGQSAPSVTANAWLNTPDSLYADAPRIHDLNDGAAHLLVFGITTNLPIVERLHHRFPDAHVMLLTATDGTLGLVAADPSAEIAWLRGYLRDPRHVTVPVGVWVGPRRPNKYGGATPEPSPNDGAYAISRSLCVLTDRHGRIYGFFALTSRRDEARVAAALARLGASSDSASITPGIHATP